ncbi:MAG: Trk system potassium transporter TrkA [Myxococcales bacterium]|nr:Trk system potassium transporter TrkA [Myxococcales bacterium]
MYIVIVGAGEVGQYLARIFVEEQHDVAIVEQDEKLARELESSLDALVVHGSGVNFRTLEKARVKRADLVLAVTQVDEVNLVACMTAAKMSRARTVARVREVGYLGGDRSLTARELGIGLVVGPERAVAEQVVEFLNFDGAGQFWDLFGKNLRLIELPLAEDSPFIHESLAQLSEVMPSPSLVAAVAGRGGLRIPRGDDRIKQGERAYVLTVPRNVEEFLILSGKPWHHVRHVLIIGCGNIGFYLAQELERRNLFPTIIELDRERADFVSRNLAKSIVLQGDGTDPDLLREQLEERADAVVVLIEDNEKALVAGLMARHLGAKKIIVRCDKRAYEPLGRDMGIDALISPRRAVADAILQFVHRGKVQRSHMLGDHDGEIMDFKIPEHPRNKEIVDKPLRELDFPQGAILGAVCRGDQVLIADGNTKLQPGDEVLVVAVRDAIGAVEKLLG